MCDRVTLWNDIRGIRTPDDFVEGYRRRYLINTHKFDPEDKTNAERYIEILHNWNLPAFLDDDRTQPNTQRRYNGDSGYSRFVNDLQATFTTQQKGA